MLNPRQHKTLLAAKRMGLFGSSIGTNALHPMARYRSIRVAPTISRVASRNHMASLVNGRAMSVNRSAYASLGRGLMTIRRRY